MIQLATKTHALTMSLTYYLLLAQTREAVQQVCPKQYQHYQEPDEYYIAQDDQEKWKCKVHSCGLRAKNFNMHLREDLLGQKTCACRLINSAAVTEKSSIGSKIPSIAFHGGLPPHEMLQLLFARPNSKSI